MNNTRCMAAFHMHALSLAITSLGEELRELRGTDNLAIHLGENGNISCTDRVDSSYTLL